MDAAGRERFEAELRRSFDAGDLRAVAERGLGGYGAEWYGFLVATTASTDVADDLFSAFCEDLWRQLPRFRWECTFRTWTYIILRGRILRHARSRARAPKQVPISRAPEVEALAAVARSVTQPHRRTTVRDRFARLREQLDPDDRILLVLRVDRDLPWREVARILGDPNEATLRKRFERIKAQLRELAGPP